MQLHHIAIFEDVIRAHVLPAERGVAPHARVTQ
jgi:hypothetical protein